MNSPLVKPLVSACTAVAIDKLYFKEQNLNRSLMFGASVGAGIYASNMVSDIVSFDAPLMDRVAEVAVGSGAAFVVNKFVMKNDLGRNDMMQRLGAIAVCSFVGEYVSDYLSGEPLNYMG